MHERLQLIPKLWFRNILIQWCLSRINILFCSGERPYMVYWPYAGKHYVPI
jgi:hypothetical protein